MYLILTHYWRGRDSNLAVSNILHLAAWKTGSVLHASTMIIQRYRDEILVISCDTNPGSSLSRLHFIGGNAKPHWAQLVEVFLKEGDICLIDLSARSTDTNATVHVLDALGRAVAQLSTPSKDPPRHKIRTFI